MRTLTKLMIGLVVVAVAATATFVVLDRRSDSDRRADTTRSGTRPAPTTTVPTVPPSTVPPTTTTTRLPGAPLPLDPRPARIAWAGDSIADSLASAVVSEAGARGVQVLNLTTSGCGMLRGDPADDNLVPISFVSACGPNIPSHQERIAAAGADVVTWLSTWETSNRVVDGQAYRFGTPEADAMLLGLIDESVQRLTAGGARLVFLTMPPNAVTPPRRPVVTDADSQKAVHLNDLLRQYAAAHADRVSILDFSALVCPGGHPCPTVVDGVTLRPEDGSHFAGDGLAWTAPRVLDQLLGPG